MSTGQLSTALSTGQYPASSMVWCDGLADWQPATEISELSNPAPATAPPPVTGNQAHEIDYEIFGHEMQFVEIELDPQESVVSEAGAMMYMTNDITMDTIFGDGSKESQSGGLF